MTWQFVIGPKFEFNKKATSPIIPNQMPDATINVSFKTSEFLYETFMIQTTTK